ncbi:MAG: bifunctional diaminohydroxyphosphoribosylaminopyrimidine deaminase/5-amino-6-(5-phosphoribosylamino)uracil reductase RibD [Myxococcales bacterium]|nr:bifunctional diaminohydroxyphosphoribosylaminopyrimidine deaminase/5-amino-6-(5-phosphoribosylamino)uracil reductase RibD [Myxococcales bacterium]
MKLTRAQRKAQAAAQVQIDEVHMARCLELAERYRGRTSPNPLVGCVIVDRAGKVLAEGAHAGPGTDHAEIVALKQLGGKAPGATLYCNLEPCNHQGRTPPCAPVVHASGVARVVIGMLDPIIEHSGGAELLQRAKVSVTTGVLANLCARRNRGFLVWHQFKRPAFTLKAAITLDGKIATVAGVSKWITGVEARTDVLLQRDRHDAVMVGIGTVLADNPRLTARFAGSRDPIRIIIDTHLRTPPRAHVLPRKAGPRTIIVCGLAAPKAREAGLVAMGAEIWRLKTHRNGRIDLYPLNQRLADQGICSVLVEGGGELHAYLLERGHADELILYIAPKVVGGPAKSWVGGKGLATLTAAYKFTFDPEVVHLGVDLRLTAAPVPVPVPPFELYDVDD